jgi:predicted regulator of Ras-like GTPase activity (Roadblock/LC7/MglB family)
MSWLIDPIVEIAEVRHAIVVSADGLQLGRSAGLTRDLADTLAAATSSLQSLSRAMAQFCDTPRETWIQTGIEFRDGWVVVAGAGPGAYLGISTTSQIDMELLGFRIQQLVGQVGRVLTSPPRESVQNRV